MVEKRKQSLATKALHPLKRILRKGYRPIVGVIRGSTFVKEAFDVMNGRSVLH